MWILLLQEFLELNSAGPAIGRSDLVEPFQEELSSSRTALPKSSTAQSLRQGFGLRPRFRSQSHFFLALWLRASDLAPLSLSFFFFNPGVVVWISLIFTEHLAKGPYVLIPWWMVLMVTINEWDKWEKAQAAGPVNPSSDFSSDPFKLCWAGCLMAEPWSVSS